MIRFLGGSGDPQNAYLVTELVENGSLWDLLHDRKRVIPWAMRIKIAYGAHPCPSSYPSCSTTHPLYRSLIYLLLLNHRNR
jgi:hypothetical protein